MSAVEPDDLEEMYLLREMCVLQELLDLLVEREEETVRSCYERMGKVRSLLAKYELQPLRWQRQAYLEALGFLSGLPEARLTGLGITDAT